MKASIFVAVEKYADTSISQVLHAEADAREFAAALEQHGFDPADGEILINEQATKTTLESVFRTTLKGLTTEDVLYLYYAGHGYSKVGGDNYVTCFDTRCADPEHTSISLKWLFQQLKESKCRRIVMFFDPCNRGLLGSEEGRHIYGDIDDVELQEFFESAEHWMCFAARRTDEQSHSSSALKHGIWAYHVIQAFDGQNPTALAGNRLTASSLQDYLKSVVPATLRKSNPAAIQTPRSYGAASSDFQLADLENIFANRRAAKHKAGQVKDSILLAESTANVKSLSGFKSDKRHFAPDRHSGYAQSFISEIAHDDIKEDVEKVRAALKGQFGFTRLQLTVENHEGAATITTPHFNYNVSVEQHPDDPGKVIWRRSVDAIIDPDQVLSDGFEAVFGDVFDTFELSLRHDVDIEQLIDFIESLGSDEIKVDYGEDKHVTACDVRIKGHNAQIQVAQNTFAVRHPRSHSPKQLVESFFAIQLALTHKHHVRMIPFEASDSSGTARTG